MINIDLDEAVESRNLSEVKRVLESMDHNDPSFSKNLQRAFIRSFVEKEPGNFAIPDYLLSQGASLTNSVELSDEQVTPMTMALRTSLENQQYLLEKGLVLPDDAIVTLVGALRDTSEEVQVLIQTHEVKSYSILDKVSLSNMNLIPYLVEKGASLVGCDEALLNAIHGGNVPIVKYLVEKGAKLERWCSVLKAQPQFGITESQIVEMIKIVIGHNACKSRPQTGDMEGSIPAVRQCIVDIARQKARDKGLL